MRTPGPPRQLARPVWLSVVCCCIGTVAAWPSFGIAAVSARPVSMELTEEQDEDLRPGLVASYAAAAGGRNAVRVDSDIQFNWEGAAPDLRVPASGFKVRWHGTLFVPGSGRYRFHLFLQGTARLSVAGRPLASVEAQEPSWRSSPETDLELGHHAIELEFFKTAPHARIGFYWESNRFAREPVGSRWLSHRAPDAPSNSFERGTELIRAYRCGACHAIPALAPERKAPSLDRLGDRIYAEWLVRFLNDPRTLRAGSRMPSMGFTPNDASAVAAYLLSSRRPTESAAKGAPAKGRPEAGETLFRSLGCQACHSLDGRGNTGPFDGGPIDRVAEKRPPGFFRDWLKKPASINAAHRMPVFVLSNEEVDDLASFLATRGEPHIQAEPIVTIEKSHVARGKDLVVARRCAACHDIDGMDSPLRVPVALHAGPGGAAKIDWDQSCLGSPEPVRNKPGFNFNTSDREAIRLTIEQLPSTVAAQSRYELGRRLMRELQCTGCHARDLEPGLQPALWSRESNGRSDPELAKLRGELEPPSLTSAGDKFHDQTLSILITGGQASRRPWLKVRMPRFQFDDHERDAILTFLIDHDRIPDHPIALTRTDSSSPHSTKTNDAKSEPPSLDATAALAAGHLLVSARGFGCMSCHTVGKHQPKAVAVNARGSDLLKIGDRLRHPWFLRWVRDPARIVPGMEMPAITVAARGILNDHVDLQLEALWQSLNSPSFVVPSDRDTAQQIISLKHGDEPVVLRDVVFDSPPRSGWCPRAFAIGLPNRHNVLFDLNSLSLRGWWVGDFARERTEGKTWLWEPGGLPVWESWTAVSHYGLRNRKTGKITIANQTGSHQLNRWLREEHAVRIDLEFSIHERRVAVSERIEAADQNRNQGFARQVRIRCDDQNHEPIVLFPGMHLEADGHGLTAAGPLGQYWVRAGEDANWISATVQDAAGRDVQCHALVLARDPTDQGSHTFASSIMKVLVESPAHAVASAAVAPDTAAAGGTEKTAAIAPRPLERIAMIPGFEAIRLPLGGFVMPTAISFRSGATPAVCSLKGQVFLAADQDGDGFEDTWQAFSDHLAAPYGLLADGDDLIVCHKPELLRLVDRKQRGQADDHRVMASGWGVTEDYHDWTFGLVRDAAGNFYIATGSDYAHKGRPANERKWRGSVLKVSPDGAIEELARGARYPTGLAMNRDGALFFTDNQGVQNTFNEINHVVPGSRYGVPAQDDPAPADDPWPERAAAIQIPHPWTRSVNGICFLDAGGAWGPFEGHGIGCEYDTQGLIRFSLQRIGQTYQGACYPFTLPADQVPQDQRLLGPISCAVSPAGDLYVGGIRDSGWGGGSNVGELVRIRPPKNIPLGIREVRAFRAGFVIEFTGPIDPLAAADLTNYTIGSYRRIWKGTYASPDSDRRTERIQEILISDDQRAATVTLRELRPGFVYEIFVRPIGPNSQRLWPSEAYYTLNQIPD